MCFFKNINIILILHFHRILFDGYDQTDLDCIDVEEIKRAMGKCVVAMDEVPVKNDSKYTGIFFLILFSIEQPLGIVLMCFKIVRDNIKKWSLQFETNVTPVLLKLNDILVPFIIADLHPAHRNLFENDLKLHLRCRRDGKEEERLFSGLNEPFHFFAHNANLLAKKMVDLVLGLKIKRGEEPRKVVMTFRGSFFDTDSIWSKFRDTATTNLQYLKQFYSRAFLEKTLKEMEDNEEKIIIQKIFLDLIQLFELLQEKREVTENDKRIMKRK